MTTSASIDRDPTRLRQALRLVLRRYGRQIRRRPLLSIGALVLPGLGDVLIVYAPPLIVVRLLAAFARGERLTARELTPYVLAFASLWLAGEIVWRFAGAFIARAEIRGMQSLYVEAMDELLAKDISFFHDNFAGSLTKRSLGYARRFEDVFDVLSFQVVANILPLGFVAVVLWTYSPFLILTLIGMLAATVIFVFPLIRRRQRLVDIRETASNVLAGHVADSIANAESVRAFAREPDEARVHALNVKDYSAKTLRSWDYQNFRVDTITAPMYVLTNTLGLIIALATGARTGAGLEAVFVTFSYYASVTRVMWEFNRIYAISRALLLRPLSLRNSSWTVRESSIFPHLRASPPPILEWRFAM